MRIIICDDEQHYIDMINPPVAQYMQERGIDAQIDTFTQSDKVLKNTDNVYDLAFLDIQMGNVDGITIAKELKLRNEKIVIFFITAFNEYQDEAMDLHVFRFFGKPFDKERLYSGLDRAMEYIDMSYVDVYLYNGGGVKRVIVDDIILMKRDNRRTVMLTSSGEITTKESLEYWIDKLPSTFFYSVHKSFYINLHYVTEYTYTMLTLCDRFKVPIASRRQSEFHKYWFEYLRRR